MLSAHYRSPLNFSADIMESSKNALERILTAAEKLRDLGNGGRPEELTAEEREKLESMKEYRKKFEEAMDDDLNTADAIAAVFELVKFANTEVGRGRFQSLCRRPPGRTDFSGRVFLGFTLEKKEESLDEEVERLIAERQAARKAKNFARADEIRAELLAKNIVLEDTREGVKWKRV